MNTKTPLLEIKDLHAAADGKAILKGLNLTMQKGEVHAIMGPNGAGKSTLAAIMAGKPGYEVTKGTVLYKGKNLLDMEPFERAAAGIFLGFQYPVEIPGVSTVNFLRTALNAQRRTRGETEVNAADFLKAMRHEASELSIDMEMMKRPVNVGFSGGEKKRTEMLQMALLKPILAILDETDSGLDIDALKIVADGINRMRNNKRSFLLITHYQRLLDYVEPDFVHVLSAGKITRTGDKSLALELEEKGYADVA